jgi:hypothetical protein
MDEVPSRPPRGRLRFSACRMHASPAGKATVPAMARPPRSTSQPGCMHALTMPCGMSTTAGLAGLLAERDRRARSGGLVHALELPLRLFVFARRAVDVFEKQQMINGAFERAHGMQDEDVVVDRSGSWRWR